MNRRLSTRILVSNLIIVIGSLLLLAVAAILLVRLYLMQETRKEFQDERAMVELLVKGSKLGSLEDVQARTRAAVIARVSAQMFDVKATMLTADMKYPSGEANRPLPEDLLSKTRTDGEIASFRYNGSDYYSTAIPLAISGDNYFILLYTNLDHVDELINRLAVIILLVLFGAALIAAVASVIVSRRIAGPLGKLSHWAHTIGGSNYGRYEERSGTTEIETLAESLNSMARRLEDYDTAQKTFLQNASHELRTPLMSIQGYAEGIKHGVFADAAYASGVIIDESLRLSALVDDLLYLSKLETAEGFYTFARVNLAEVLSQCAEKLEGAAMKEGKEIALTAAEDAYVMADGEKLLRAVMNLAGNCLRYADKKVEMGLTSQNGKAVVTVRDDGPGFDPEDFKQLFVRFYKGKKGKFGLGLSIARAIVEKHEGTISAGNNEAGGAVFTVSLPLASGQVIH